MKSPRILVVPLLCTSLCGCATLMHGGPTSNVDVAITSPAGQLGPIDARFDAFNLNDRGMASTSAFQMKLDKRSGYRLTIMAPHYEDFNMTIGRRITPWYWGNVAIAAAPYALLLLTSPFWPSLNYGTNMTIGILGFGAGIVTVPLGLAGLVVDAMNANMWEHDPNPVEVNLFPTRKPD